MKIAFFGTPDFAIPTLRSLVNGKEHKVVCVVTQPDKPSGRSGEVAMSAVKKFALERKIPVLQPERISNEIRLLDKYAPDVIVTCAFGQVLKENVLNYCKYGVVNVHASLLPKYRGSSPIQWAIINGEKRTGITIMQTDVGLDTGDIILQMPIDIKDNETAAELFVRLADLGSIALKVALSQIATGRVRRFPQNNLNSSHFPMLRKETARVRWTLSAQEINNFVRGLNPWPVAYFSYGALDIRVYRAMPFTLSEARKFPFIKIKEGQGIGTVLHSSSQNGLFVLCNSSVLRIDEIQIPGGRKMPTRDFLNGRNFEVGAVFN